MMAASMEKGNAAGNEDRMRCFVCDVVATGRYYILATCRTQTTRIRLIEKLGQLVGERYMVVISEDDIICRSCANLMNTLDRLETEIGSVRNVVLRFLEKKYSLEDGELLNNKTTGVPIPQLSPAPSVPRRTAPTSENFMSRKRKAAMAELENERESSVDTSTGKRMKNDSKKDIWMQCDKCKYTTNLNSFMIHHIRQHVKKKPEICELCGEEVKAGTCSNNCAIKKRTELQQSTSSTSSIMQNSRPVTGSISNFPRQTAKQFPDSISRPPDSEAETVQMIAAEINEYITASRNATVVETVTSSASQLSGHNVESVHHVETLQDISQTPDSSSQTSVGNVTDMQQIETALHSVPMNGTDNLRIDSTSLSQNHAITLPEHLQNGDGTNSAPTAICVMNMSEQTSAAEQTLLLQNMNDDNNAVYVQVVEVGKGDEVHDTSNMPKQVLTVADDGTVEMVEVMWNEMVQSHVSSGQDVQF